MCVPDLFTYTFTNGYIHIFAKKNALFLKNKIRNTNMQIAMTGEYASVIRDKEY